MSTWDEIMGLPALHDRGRWFDLPHPATGAATGIELLVAGPAGLIARAAQWGLLDALAAAQADATPIPAAARERLRLDALAAHVLGWRGEGLPAFTPTEARRALGASKYLADFLDAAIGSALHNIPDANRGPAGLDAIDAMAATLRAQAEDSA